MNHLTQSYISGLNKGIKDKDGNIKFVSSPLKVTTSPRVMTRGQTQQLANATTSKSPVKEEMEVSVTATGQGDVDQAAMTSSKPRRTGSVGLFFRKVRSLRELLREVISDDPLAICFGIFKEVTIISKVVSIAMCKSLWGNGGLWEGLLLWSLQCEQGTLLVFRFS